MTTPNIQQERTALRRDTAANWISGNPILFSGEEGYETDTGRRKIGDGSTPWSVLSYQAGSTLVDTPTKSTTYTAAVGQAVLVDYSNGTFAVTAPPVPANGMTTGYFAIRVVKSNPSGLPGIVYGPDGATVLATPVLAGESIVFKGTAQGSWIPETGYNSAASNKAQYLGGTVLFGTVDPTGVKDSTSAIQAIITAATGPVYGLPGANYKISSGINLKSGSVLRANGAKITSSVNGPVFNYANISNVEISDWYISGIQGTYLIQGTGITDLLLSHNNLTNISLVQLVGAGDGSYSNGSYTNNVGVRIVNNRGVAPATGNDGFGVLRYCSDVNVVGNEVDGYGHGFYFWGGDAGTGAGQNGAVANARQARNITMTCNTVRNCNQGGLWGSMGTDITISANTVENCADVGVDFEGCFGAIAGGNTVTDCTNGNLTSFSLNEGVLFVGNTSIITKTSCLLAHVYNSSQDRSYGTGNRSVSFVENEFINRTGSVADISIEAVNDFTFSRNRLTNTKISAGNNGKNSEIDNNRFLFTYAAAAKFSAIQSVFNNSTDGLDAFVRITGNRIMTTVGQPNGSFAILVNEGDFNGNPRVQIMRNECWGWSADLSLISSSTNGGTRAYFLIKDNILASPTPVTTADTGTAGVYVRAGNYNGTFGVIA